jgi:hypothetical protein
VECCIIFAGSFSDLRCLLRRRPSLPRALLLLLLLLLLRVNQWVNQWVSE